MKNSIYQIAKNAILKGTYNSLTEAQRRSLCRKVLELQAKLTQRSVDQSVSRRKALNVSRHNERIARKLEREIYALKYPKRKPVTTKADVLAAANEMQRELKERRGE